MFAGVAPSTSKGTVHIEEEAEGQISEADACLGVGMDLIDMEEWGLEGSCSVIGPILLMEIEGTLGEEEAATMTEVVEKMGVTNSEVAPIAMTMQTEVNTCVYV